MFTSFPPEYYVLLEEKDHSVLLETSRFDESNDRSYLFLDPIEILEATSPGEAGLLIDTIEAYILRSYTYRRISEY